jgi:hypothetical protein
MVGNVVTDAEDAAGNVYTPVQGSLCPREGARVIASGTVPADRDRCGRRQLLSAIRKRLPQVGGDPSLGLGRNPGVQVRRLNVVVAIEGERRWRRSSGTVTQDAGLTAFRRRDRSRPRPRTSAEASRSPRP